MSIGHENNKLKLRNIVENKTVGHAYLFTGKKGIGKKLVAMEFSKSILCLNPVSGQACNSCEACRTFQNNSDFKIIEPEKDVIKVDTIRNFETELFLLPTISDRKVYIIDDADTMNEQAQNALLKVLEEPPTYATIILITSNKEKLLGTIKSRVIEIKFDGLSEKELEEILRGLDIEASKEAIKYANGSVTKALDFINDNTFKVAKEIANVLLERDFLKANRKFEEIKADKNLKANIDVILEKVMYIFYNMLKQDINFDFKLIENVEEVIQNIKRNANVDLALDVLMTEICKI